MKDRIIEFLKQENKSARQFAEEIGVQASSVSHILSGRNNPSLDFVVKMLAKYPYISTDWLLFGKGQMLSESKQIDLFSSDPINESFDIFNKKSAEPSDRSDVTESGKRPVKDNLIVSKPDYEKKTIRIVWFYEDGTFREFLPG
jgi:transcriptional regulator with XRE-family HTH domain